jgi:hypothetical protein
MVRRHYRRAMALDEAEIATTKTAPLMAALGQSEKSRRRLTTSAFESSSDMIAKTHWASVTPEIGQ